MTPYIGFDDMPRKEARAFWAAFLERHDERRAWLHDRLGFEPSDDRQGAVDLWRWWVTWRTAPDWDPEQPATLPPWWPTYDPDHDPLTPVELELVDAGAYLLADIALGLSPVLRWRLETRKSYADHNQMIVADDDGFGLNPIEQLRGSAMNLAAHVEGRYNDPDMQRPERILGLFDTAETVAANAASGPAETWTLERTESGGPWTHDLAFDDDLVAENDDADDGPDNVDRIATRLRASPWVKAVEREDRELLLLRSTADEDELRAVIAKAVAEATG